MASQLYIVMGISFTNFLFPLNILMEFILTTKTNRRPGELGVDFFNEFALFLITGFAQYFILFEFPSLTYSPTNQFMDAEIMTTS